MNPPTSFRVHDLLRINSTHLLAAHTGIPAWVPQALTAAPCAVVRRGPSTSTTIPIGIRGQTRDQRWPAICPHEAILASATPSDLLAARINPRRLATIPALQALQSLKTLWANLPWPWGPAGSIGFELFSGIHTASTSSDLDIILHAPQPIPRTTAQQLHAQLQNLPCRIDVRIETPTGGFALTEFASAPQVLLRSDTGELLSSHPWPSATSPVLP